jgi:hypothetical protein
LLSTPTAVALPLESIPSELTLSARS